MRDLLANAPTPPDVIQSAGTFAEHTGQARSLERAEKKQRLGKNVVVAFFRALQFLHSTHDRTSCGDQSTAHALKKAGSHWEYHRSQSCGGRRPGFALPEKVRSPPAMELGEVETRRGGRARLLRLQGQGASVAGRAAPQVGPVFVSLWGCSNQTVVVGPLGIVILFGSRVPG